MPGASAWWMSAFLACVACSGDDFTSGGNTGGQNAGGQTSGGGTGATGGAATGGVAGTPAGGSGGVAGTPPPTGGAAGVPSSGGSAGSGPISCEYGAGECPPGHYCDALGCQSGTCKLKPSDEDGSLQEVCGCDGITYWNATVAAKHGESVKGAGTCNLSGQSCAGGGCPGSAKCRKTVLNAALCGGADLLTQCWMLPENCLGAEEPVANGCVNGCKSVCKLIDMGEEYYGNSCN